MRILVVGAVPGRLHQGPVTWGGREFEVTPRRFSSFADYRTAARDVVDIDPAGMAALVDATRGFDVVVCESPEAVVLAREWAKRGEAPRGIVAFDIHQLHRVRAVRGWYERTEGSDPWPAVRAAAYVVWGVNSAHQVAPLVAAGVPAERVHRIFGCSGAFRMLLPDADERLDGGPAADGPAAAGLPAGAAAMPGTGRRDHVTGLRAAALLPDVPFVAVAEHAERRRPALARLGLDALPNVRWLDPLPLAGFIALLRRARLVVVPLAAGTGDGGHLTVGLAHRLGVPVVASDVPGITDYVDHGQTAHLVPADDPAALAAAIRCLWDDGPARDRLVAGARAVEQARCAAFSDAMDAAIDEAAEAAQEARR